MARIAIVGAGLMGRLAALMLRRQGWAVSLFDQANKSAQASAAWAAGGLLTPLGESLHCQSGIVEMGLKSLEMWPDLLQTLQHPVFFQRTGAIMVSHPQDRGDMQRFKAHLAKHWPQQPQQPLDRATMASLEPSLSQRFSTGLWLPQEGQIDNRQLLLALQHQLEDEGVEWHCNVPLHDLEPLQTNHDLVIDCRGVGACAQLPDLRGVRGELFHVIAPEVKLSRPIRLMHPRYQLYIAPKLNHRFIIGATEIESDDNSPMTVRSALELLSAAYSVDPAFAEAHIVEQLSQCRPAFSDNQPQIQLSGSLIHVNGLYRHGFLIAPVVLQQLLQLVTNLAEKSEQPMPPLVKEKCLC